MKKLSLGLLALTAASCAGTDTGNPVDPEQSNAGSESCSQVESELSPETPTSLGFTAQDIVALVSGEHRETLAWQDTSVSYGPESGSGEIRLVVEALGTARFIDRSPKLPGAMSGPGGGEVLTIGTTLADPLDDGCGDLLEVDVRLGISTAGGALNESLQTTLTASSAEFAQGDVRLATDALGGTFEVNVPVQPGFVQTQAPSLRLQLGISPYGSVGELGVLSEVRSTDGLVAGQNSTPAIAHFPAENFCGPKAVSVARDQTLRGVSMSSVLDRLGSGSPAVLDPGAAALSLDFSSRAERVCVRLDAPASGTTRLEFPAQVSLSSPPAHIEGSIAIDVTAEASDGQLRSVRASASAYVTDPSVAAAEAARFAIVEPLDLSTYDGAAFEFSTVIDPNASGFLRAYGVRDPNCSSAPVQEPGGGVSVPGCPGQERTQLWGYTWGG